MKNKEFLETNLSQFGVWEDLQMVYSLFIFNFLLFNWVGLCKLGQDLFFTGWAHFIFLISLSWAVTLLSRPHHVVGPIHLCWDFISNWASS
jgi:hypothetical protein